MEKKSANKRPRKEAVPSKLSIHEEISRKAYDIYEQKGREQGKDVEHWLEAEEFIMGSKKK